MQYRWDLSRIEGEASLAHGKDSSAQQAFRIFIFHHAGGSAQNYQLWQNFFPSHWNVRLVQYPGRDQADDLCQDMNDLVLRLITELQPELDRPYALFGHSMGSLVAYAFAQHVAMQGLRQPTWLGVSGRHAPHLPPRIDYAMYQLSDAALLNNVMAMGATPVNLLTDVQLRQHFLKVIRADFKVCETYHITRDQQIDIPISGFYGSQDAMVTSIEMNAWRELTTTRFDCHAYQGGHFYLGLLKKVIAEQIIQDVARSSRLNCLATTLSTSTTNTLNESCI
jgi:surfactin synthase thioesterase subunit